MRIFPNFCNLIAVQQHHKKAKFLLKFINCSENQKKNCLAMVFNCALFTAWWCYTGWVKRVILASLSHYITFLVWHHPFWYYITLFPILLHPFGIIFTLFPILLHPFGIIFTLLVILLHLFGVISTLLAVSLHCIIVDSSKPRMTPGRNQNTVYLANNQRV